MKHFVAFSSKDKTHAEAITAACLASNTSLTTYIPWSIQDRSGSPVTQAVEEWINDCENFVADITFANDNVTYELGYAIGSGKDIRIIRNSSISIDQVKSIGLFDGLLRDEFRTRQDLEVKLRDRPAPQNKWPRQPANTRQPIYVLSPPSATPFTTKLFSAVKKKIRIKYRSFNPREIPRLTAQEAWEQVSISSGVIVTWSASTDATSVKNNQRAAFLFGLACGLGIPALLLAQEKTELPSDLQAKATRYATDFNLLQICTDFRDEVQDALNSQHVEENLPYVLLDAINCGDPAAENEQDYLKQYFLETPDFKETFEGTTHLIVGRKGSGKSAIFLQVRDRTRANKNNIVIDLNPEGYQLIKFKEVVIQLRHLGNQKEFIDAFWQYVLWLEIAYKLLEKDIKVVQHNSTLGEKYYRLRSFFEARVDTGAGDFSERLRLLTDLISERFDNFAQQKDLNSIKSSEILQIIYGSEIAQLRDEILSYLKQKDCVLFLFDNLDRMRTTSSFDQDDAILIVGLIEAMQSIAKSFRKSNFDFRWALFIRSDVYHFVVGKMADYGKHTVRSLDWSDKDVLKRLLQRRIVNSLDTKGQTWDSVWSSISVPQVGESDVFDFIVAASLMRPRYVIKIFEAAKRRAVNMGHQKIEEADYMAALEDLGWNVSEDLDLELRDIVPDTSSLLYDIGQLEGACGLPELREAIEARVGATDIVEKVFDVLLWSGAIGIAPHSGPAIYIFDCGYKLQYLRSLIEKNPSSEVKLHPTLSYVISQKAAAREAA